MDKFRTYGKLREKIRFKFRRIEDFSEAIGRDRSSISQKLNGGTAWTQTEIEQACAVLDIPKEKIHEYFFYDM